jgi:hypothetical protein
VSGRVGFFGVLKEFGKPVRASRRITHTCMQWQISDESHRSIYDTYKQVVDYFHAIKLELCKAGCLLGVACWACRTAASDCTGAVPMGVFRVLLGNLSLLRICKLYIPDSLW